MAIWQKQGLKKVAKTSSNPMLFGRLIGMSAWLCLSFEV
jgi:hypothetical protein